MLSRKNNILLCLLICVMMLYASSAQEAVQKQSISEYISRVYESKKYVGRETNCVPTRETYVSCVITMIEEENENILDDRARVMELLTARAEDKYVTDYDRAWFEGKMLEYSAKDVQDLLVKMDVIPVKMALAQSILESGWGTSYAATVGKGLFGQIQAAGQHDIEVPWKSGPDKPQPFKTHRASVHAYFMNLNTHFAYVDFRKARVECKDPVLLMNHMKKYSIRGQDYIRQIQGIIKSI